MTSVIPVVDRKLRVKGQRNEKPLSDDSTRAFLNFSRENLSVSQTDIEQGFNRQGSRCSKINRQTLLSLLAIFLAVVCLAFETIKIKKIVDNARDIEVIRGELETLKQRIYEENFFDELRAFEQQLYADEEDDFNDTDLGGDYDDSNYDDYETSQNKYLNDYETTSSMKSDQSTIASASIESKDVKIVPDLQQVEENSNNKSVKSQNVKTKRFITEDPPTAYDNGKTPFLQTVSSGDSKNETNKNLLTSNHSRNSIFPKKYYGRKRQRPHKKSTPEMKKSMKSRGMTRRHIRPSRQIFAAHYGADSSLFRGDDEHTGNGRARHDEGIFKAWRGSDWMDDLGMNRYFSLARDGRLTVHETGLYLVYAQIHYLDEHDENGFHLLVNGRPILQCMVYSPGNGHKSRSCFSAQVTYLVSGDRIVLKEVGPARYTLFQAEKSFFGLAKLGDSRQSHQNQTRHNMSIQSQTTPFQ